MSDKNDKAGTDPGELVEITKKKKRTDRAATRDEAIDLMLELEVERLNQEHFVVIAGSRVAIARIERDEALQRDRVQLLRTHDFVTFYRNRCVMVGRTSDGEPKYRDLGSVWLEHPKRRTYRRMALLPDQDAPEDTFNLWRGWGLEPKAGRWPKLQWHLQHVICGGDTEAYLYLLAWLGWCVQHPDRPAEVAVVLRGRKGTGKGTLGHLLRRIFSHHSLHITHGRHLTGNFNAHLADALYLFVDEAFWAGDRAAEGVLKGLITEPVLTIEPKGLDVFMVPNRLKILMATNNDWAVPATGDERRFFVLDVSDVKRGDKAYFAALHKALEGGEAAAFLFDLMAMCLDGVDIRAVPQTRALAEQKLLSLESHQEFWRSCLYQGRIVGTPEDSNPHSSGWPGTVRTSVLYAAYLDFCDSRRIRHPANDVHLARELCRLSEGCPGFHWSRRAEHGKRGYRLGSLEDHRKAFCQALGIDPDDAGWLDEEAGS
jgi:hypothetical protein